MNGTRSLLHRLALQSLLIAALLSTTGAAFGPLLHLRAILREGSVRLAVDDERPGQAPTHREQECALCHLVADVAVPASEAGTVPGLVAVHRAVRAPELAPRVSTPLRASARAPPVDR